MTPWRTISVALNADPTGIVAGTAAGSAAVKRFGADSEKTLARHTASVGKVGSTWQTLAKGLVAGLAVVGVALGLSLHEAIAWESAFAGVAKTVDGTASQLSQLEDGLLGLARQLPATRTEIAGVAEAAGALGIQRQSILGFTEVMVGLGEATNLTADEAATMLAQFGNIMGTSQDSFEDLADTLVNLGNNGASTEKEILELALRLAGVGRTLGLTENQVFALANAMASMGIDAQLGGGALSRVMRKVEVAVADGGSALRGFAEASGMSAAEFQQAWQTDPAATLQTFLEAMKDVQDAGGNMYGILSDLGIKGTQDLDVIGRLIGGSDGLAQSFRDAESSSGALADEVAKRYATAESQLKIFRNRVTDVARVVGAALIPMLLGALKAAEAFGRWLATTGAAAAEKLSGAWGDLQGAGADLADLFSALWDAGSPVVSLFAQIGGGIAIGGLTTLASLLETTTGFLADHEELVIAIGIAYAGWKAVGVVENLTSLFVGLISKIYATGTAFAATKIGTSLLEIADGAKLVGANLLTVPDASARMATGVTSGLGQMRTGLNSFASAIGPVNAGIAGLAIGATLAYRAAERGAEQAKKRALEFVEALQIDPNDPMSVAQGMSDINDRVDELREKAKDKNFDVGGFTFSQNTADQLNPFNTNEIQDARDELKELGNESVRISAAFIQNNALIGEFGKGAGLSISEVRSIASEAGIDISTAFDSSGRASKELEAAIERLGPVAELTGKSISDAAQMSADELELVEESIKRIEEAGEAARSSWAEFSNVLQLTDDPVDPDAVKRSEEMVADARERVREAEKEARAGGQSADEAQRTADALSDARDALVDATESHADLLGTDSPLNAEKVQQFYEDRLAEARTFTANLQTAIAAGYDPALISRLMQAGPEQAGPVLEALVEDTSAAYVESINRAEGALTDFTEFATRQAQLTQRAIELGTRQAAEGLGTALAIEQMSMLDPTLTGNEIAERLGITLTEAQRVIDDFDLGVTVVAKTDMNPAEEDLGRFVALQRFGTIGYTADISKAETEIERLTRTRRADLILDLKVNGDLSSLGATLAANAGPYGKARRWGGIDHYAAGGIRDRSMIGSGKGIVWWDEPETGGEAYFPRNDGDRSGTDRNMRTVAGWYGGMYLSAKELSEQAKRALSQIPATRGPRPEKGYWAEDGSWIDPSMWDRPVWRPGMPFHPGTANPTAPPPRPVPYGGAMVPGRQEAEFGGRRSGDVHFHKVTSDDRSLLREADQRMKLWA